MILRAGLLFKICLNQEPDCTVEDRDDSIVDMACIGMLISVMLRPRGKTGFEARILASSSVLTSSFWPRPRPRDALALALRFWPQTRNSMLCRPNYGTR